MEGRGHEDRGMDTDRNLGPGAPQDTAKRWNFDTGDEIIHTTSMKGTSIVTVTLYVANGNIIRVEK